MRRSTDYFTDTHGIPRHVFTTSKNRESADNSGLQGKFYRHCLYLVPPTPKSSYTDDELKILQAIIEHEDLRRQPKEPRAFSGILGRIGKLPKGMPQYGAGYRWRLMRTADAKMIFFVGLEDLAKALVLERF